MGIQPGPAYLLTGLGNPSTIVPPQHSLSTCFPSQDQVLTPFSLQQPFLIQTLTLKHIRVSHTAPMSPLWDTPPALAQFKEQRM